MFMLDSIGRVERKLLALVALFYLSLMLLIGAIWGSQTSFSSGRDVQELYRSLYRLSLLLPSLQEAELDQRGYLLTGKARYLEPYALSVERFDEQLRGLLDTPTMQAHEAELQAIAELGRFKRDEMALTLDLYREQGRAAAMEQFSDERGERYMGEMRTRIASIERAVAIALKAHKADIEWRSMLALWGGGGGALLMLGLLTLLFVDLRRDLRERGELLERMAFESQHDSLTHLLNRRAFNDTLDQALALARRGERSVALLYLDLDGFKTINDKLGHALGDAVLKSVAARWKTVVREGEVLARLGGDEFAVIAAGDTDAVEHLAQRLIAALDGPLLVQQPDVRVGVSVGLARCAEHGEDRRRLVASADMAMYRAKKAGKHCYAWPEERPSVLAVV